MAVGPAHPPRPTRPARRRRARWTAPAPCSPPSGSRAFPVRSWAARRWSIDHNVTDPAARWAGYNTERAARRDAYPAGRLAIAWAALTGTLPTSTPPADLPAASTPPADPPVVGDADKPKRAPRKTGKTDTATAVARLRARHPDMPTADIAKRLKVSDRTVRRHLNTRPTQPGDAAPLAA